MLAALFFVIALYLVAVVQATEAPQPAPAPTMHASYHRGDPYETVYYPTQIHVANGTKQPIMTITDPANDTAIVSRNLTVTYILDLESSMGSYPINVTAVWYRTSWQHDNFVVNAGLSGPVVDRALTLTLNLTDVPEGNQTLTMYVYATCEYETHQEYVEAPASPSGFIMGKYLNVYTNFYEIAGSSTISFTVKTPSPTSTPLNNASPANALPYVEVAVLGTAVTLASLSYYLRNRQRHPKIQKNSLFYN